MAAVSQHLSTAWLFTCFICQMRRRNCGARCYRIAADVGINQSHSHILRQCVESPFRRSVSSAAEGAGAIDGRNVNDNPVILRQENLQSFPDIAHRAAQIGVHHIHHPVVIGFIDHFLFTDTGVVDKNIHIAKFLQSSFKYPFGIVGRADVGHHADRFPAFCPDAVHNSVQFFLMTGGNYHGCAFFRKQFCHRPAHAIAGPCNDGDFILEHLCFHFNQPLFIMFLFTSTVYCRKN